jgi:DNA polymerase (family 10)
VKTNAEIAESLQRIADLLEIQGENVFRIRAYRNAARTVSELPEGIAAMISRGEDLTELPGIGEDLAGKITELARTGRVPLLDRLARRLPGELAEMMRLPGLGPKRVGLLHEKLHIKTLAELKAAAAAGRIQDVPGIGKKTEKAILDALERVLLTSARTKVSGSASSQAASAGGEKPSAIWTSWSPRGTGRRR